MRSRHYLLSVFVLAAGAGSVHCVGDSTVPVDPGSGDGSADGAPAGMQDAGGSVDSGSSGDAQATCPATATTDYYVDPVSGLDANVGSGGSCPLKTITAALAKSAKAYNATIHLAAGTYAAGETFPLIVDKGRSVKGAGAATTTIQGSSTQYNTLNTGSFLDPIVGVDGGAPNPSFVTILAGDVPGGANNIGTTTISGVTVVPASTVTKPAVGSGYVGIACITGNGPNQSGTNGVMPTVPAPNLVLSAVTVGPNYENDVVLGSEPTNTTACNAKIVASTFAAANIGVVSGSCGTANPSVSWPSSQIGDGTTANANTFTGTNIGLLGGGCGSSQSINGNHFVSGYRGMVMISKPGQYFEVLDNTFDGSTAPNMGVGLDIGSGTMIAKLNDNVFSNISQSAAADLSIGAAITGYAIRLEAFDVAQARRNKIHDNDNGVLMTMTPQADFDFSGGLAAQSNQNVFYCNSDTHGGVGYDVILNNGVAGKTANFEGNIWDHNPAQSGAGGAANATDAVQIGAATLDVSNAYPVAAPACAAGRVK